MTAAERWRQVRASFAAAEALQVVVSRGIAISDLVLITNLH